MSGHTNSISDQLWAILETVKDPEIPVLSVVDLGIVRGIQWVETTAGKGRWEILITPTYSGCPAMDMISTGIRMALYAAGILDFELRTILSPAWTTAWMSEQGKAKLKAYGIAPPKTTQARVEKLLDEGGRPATERPEGLPIFADDPAVACPRCGSAQTKLLSAFGSTSCKALYQCMDCKEPFEYFKCH